jgi:hypothetical protein
VKLALGKLEQEGLVVSEPNRGARVRVISEQEALEILQVRTALESLIARQAATRATPADRKRLREILHVARLTPSQVARSASTSRWLGMKWPVSIALRSSAVGSGFSFFSFGARAERPSELLMRCPIFLMAFMAACRSPACARSRSRLPE